MNKVYEVGYDLNNAQQRVANLMADKRMLLIDTRIKPRSWRHDWEGKTLQERYGERYRQAGKFLGNLNYKGGPIRLADPSTGIRGLIMYLREGHDLILLCHCASYDNCHRKEIIRLLKEAMPDVEIVGQEQAAQQALLS